jgi:hypothetical protein
MSTALHPNPTNPAAKAAGTISKPDQILASSLAIVNSNVNTSNLPNDIEARVDQIYTQQDGSEARMGKRARLPIVNSNVNASGRNGKPDDGSKPRPDSGNR